MAVASRTLHLCRFMTCIACYPLRKCVAGNQIYKITLLSSLRVVLSSNFARSSVHHFAKPRVARNTKNGPFLERKPDSKNSTVSEGIEDDDDDSDWETDDDEKSEERSETSSKSKRKSWSKSQKSALNKTVKPSKYLFRDVRENEEEEPWMRRRAPVDAKSKASWYARQMLRLSRDNQVDKAYELLSEMKGADVQPTVEIFNILISAYAKAGKVRKAFNLYNDMKKRRLEPTCYTYSSLFNACAKAPVPEHALQRAKKVLAEIQERIRKKDLEIHPITYNAAIQAFTVCGNPSQAFEVYREMQDSRIAIDVYAYASLLGACCHDHIDGPRTAFQILEEMKASDAKPDIFVFNAVLKVIRDFTVYTQQQRMQLAVNEEDSVNRKSTKEEGKEQVDSEPKLHRGKEEKGTPNDSNVLPQGLTEVVDKQNSSSNLLDYFPGVEKFLHLMALEDVQPDVRTFQMLLYLTSSLEEEEYLMQVMKDCNVTPDVTFYNTLVKRKASQGDLMKAKKHMQELKDKLKVSPTEKSFTTLAAACEKHTEGLQLLEDIQAEGMTPTLAVYEILISGAAKRRKFDYLIKLIKHMTNDGIQPSDHIMEILTQAHRLPLKMPHIPASAHLRVKRNRRRRYMEQKGFDSYFVHWKRNLFGLNTTTIGDKNIEHTSPETELDDSEENSTYGHL